MVDVVEKPDCDPALVRGKKGGEDERARIGLEADVVQREIEVLFGPGDERCGLPGDCEGRLAAVAQERELDRRATRGVAQLVRSDGSWACFGR